MRFGAYVIDYIIIYCAQAFIAVPVLALFGISFVNQASNFDGNASDGDIIAMVITMVTAGAAIAFLVFVLQVLYYSFMESSKYQGTLGKMALGLIVTDANGAKLDFTKALIRNLGKIVSWFVMGIGFIMAGFTEKKQALHDMIASTLVVKK
jgi:uncharacterized RDD family membrane protein YckC